MTESSLQVTDSQSAAVAVAPRVTLADIEGSIVYEGYKTAAEALAGTPGESSEPFSILTLCFLEMKNGYTVIGKAAPASPANFNAELGQKFAREDAIRQLWPIMGYALREKLQDSV